MHVVYSSLPTTNDLIGWSKKGKEGRTEACLVIGYDLDGIGHLLSYSFKANAQWFPLDNLRQPTRTVGYFDDKMFQVH